MDTEKLIDCLELLGILVVSAIILAILMPIFIMVLVPFLSFGYIDLGSPSDFMGFVVEQEINGIPIVIGFMLWGFILTLIAGCYKSFIFEGKNEKI